MTYIGEFLVDVATSEEHVDECDVTDNPVEAGAAITDNVRRRPRTLTLECVVSDTPIGAVAEARGLAEQQAAATEAFLQQLNIIGAPSTLNPYRTAADECRAFLARTLSAREPITVTTEIRTYESMVLYNVSESRTATTGDAIRFRAMFRQVRIVTNERSTVRVAVPRAKKRKKIGNRPPTPVIKTDLDTCVKEPTAAAQMDEWNRAHPNAGTIDAGGAGGHW